MTKKNLSKLSAEEIAERGKWLSDIFGVTRVPAGQKRKVKGADQK